MFAQVARHTLGNISLNVLPHEDVMLTTVMRADFLFQVFKKFIVLTEAATVGIYIL